MPKTPRRRRAGAFVQGASCPASFKKLVWHDGYDAAMGYPQKQHAGLKVPRGCSAAFRKKVWHDGYDAAESHKALPAADAEAVEEDGWTVLADGAVLGALKKVEEDPSDAANLAKLDGLSRQTLNFAENVALKAGLAPDLVSSLKKLGIEIGLAFS